MREKERLDRYGGRYPSVSLNSDGTAVVVSNSTMGNAMWYWVGRVDETTDEIFWSNGCHFDYGIAPKVALKESGLVIEVHRSQWKHELKCAVGHVSRDSTSIKWRAPSTYANGTDATAAVNNSDTVVTAHVSNDTHIECKAGKASSKSIRWGESNTIGTGKSPSVAINENDTVILVYQDETHCRVWCRIGIVNKMVIYWGKSIQYANGLNASVCLTSTNDMLVLRQGVWLDELLYGVAKVNPEAREIVEDGPIEQCRNRKLCEHRLTDSMSDVASHTTFWHPSIAVNDQGTTLAVYASKSCQNCGGPALWYQVGGLGRGGEEDDTEGSDPPMYYGSDDEQYLSSPSPSDEC